MRESEKLQLIATQFGYSNGIMQSSIAHCFGILLEHLAPGNILELGPAEGVMTAMLHGTQRHISVVEGSTKFCEMIKARFSDVDVFNTLFEQFAPVGKFNNIVLGHVLEHVEDPEALLMQIKNWLAPGGIVFAAVPNAKSLHRQAAVMMGLLETENTLNSADIDHGHRRVFNPDEFLAIFKNTGYSIRKTGGYWLKPLSNKQIEDSWTPEMIAAFMQLGERFPEIAGEIYLVASK
jgi:2-polyprenyl-3-methyl-5-hydroxy-6-metoxy-1,4-benzoquinol methylase